MGPCKPLPSSWLITEAPGFVKVLCRSSQLLWIKWSRPVMSERHPSRRRPPFLGFPTFFHSPFCNVPHSLGLGEGDPACPTEGQAFISHVLWGLWPGVSLDGDHLPLKIEALVYGRICKYLHGSLTSTHFPFNGKDIKDHFWFKLDSPIQVRTVRVACG